MFKKKKILLAIIIPVSYTHLTKLYYVISRYYSPELCRFINLDSISLVGVSPMTLTDKNLYAYCDNNPVMRKDEEGLFWVTAGIMLIGGVIGSAIGAVSSIAVSYTHLDVYKRQLFNRGACNRLCFSIDDTALLPAKRAMVAGNA